MNISEIFTEQKAYFESGATLPLRARRAALNALGKAIKAHETELADALHADLGKSRTESYMCEIGLTLSELSHQKKHLRGYMKARRHLTGLANFPGRSYTVRNPYGCVLVMSPWNYPVLLTLEPLIGAIAAGNCCILKPSAYSPATSAVIAKLIRSVFPPEYVAVVEGGRAENQSLLDLPFDYIFFTGGVTVGKTVMEKAAAHLTPITLELGGKSPCIIDRTADLSIAAKRIAFGKYLNCGQTCVAPDYVLIDPAVKDEFLARLKKEITAMYGEAPLDNPNYGKIINQKHFDRLCTLIDPEKVVIGGERDTDGLRIAPTVMDGVTADDAVMGEEIFGPILPVLTYDSIEQAQAFVRARPHPLACYLFTRDKALMRRFRDAWQFGGGCINDTVIHLATSRMPFGGVGDSGMGAYHGRRSFETFSHEKSIVKRSCLCDIPVRNQPYSSLKDALLHIILH